MIILTENLLDEIEWVFKKNYVNKKHIEKYFNYRLGDTKYNYIGDSVEVFIENEFFHDDFERDSLEVLVDELIRDEFNAQVTGEETSYIIDKLLESSISVYSQAEML